MRAALLAVMAIGTLSALGTPPAQARPSGYPICMRTMYGDDDCSYSNFQQCMAAASGLGLTCFQNPALAYDPDPRGYGDQPPPRRQSRQRRDY